MANDITADTTDAACLLMMLKGLESDQNEVSLTEKCKDRDVDVRTAQLLI